MSFAVLAAATEAVAVADWTFDDEFGLSPADIAELELEVIWVAYRAVTGEVISGIYNAQYVGPLVEALSP